MDEVNVQQWLALFSAAAAIGTELLNFIKNHAAATLTPDEYAALEARWNADVVESAVNAGITPEPDVPVADVAGPTIGPSSNAD